MRVDEAWLLIWLHDFDGTTGCLGKVQSGSTGSRRTLLVSWGGWRWPWRFWQTGRVRPTRGTRFSTLPVVDDDPYAIVVWNHQEVMEKIPIGRCVDSVCQCVPHWLSPIFMGHSGIAQQNESTWLILRKKMVINYLVLVHGGVFFRQTDILVRSHCAWRGVCSQVAKYWDTVGLAMATSSLYFHCQLTCLIYKFSLN